MSAPAPSMFTPAAKAMTEQLGLKKGRANLEEFADTLLLLAKSDRQIVAVTSDSRERSSSVMSAVRRIFLTSATAVRTMRSPVACVC